MSQGLFEYGSGKKNSGGLFRSKGKSIFESAPRMSQKDLADEEKKQRLADQRRQLKNQQKKKNQKPKNLADLAKGTVKAGGAVGRFFLGGTAKLANTAVSEAKQVGYTGEMMAANATHNTKAFENANKASQNAYKNDNKDHTGLLGVGTVFKDSKEAQSGSLKTGARRIGGGTLESASELLPAQTIKLLKGGKLARKVAEGAIHGAAIGGAGGAGNKLLNDDKITGQNTLADLAAGSILGAGGTLASKVVGRGLRKAVDKVKGKIPEVNADEGLTLTRSMADVKPSRARKIASADRALLDRNQPVKELVSEAESVLGRKLKVGENPYELLKLRGGVEGQAITHLRETAGWMKDIPADIRKDGDNYGYAKQFLSQADKRTPEQLAKAQKIVDHLQQKYGDNIGALEDYNKKTRKTFDSLVDMYEKEGIISKDHATNLRNNPDYFAKMEVLQDETGPLLRGNQSTINVREPRALKGIKGQANDSLLAPSAESYVSQSAKAIEDVANNRVGRSIGNLADQLGDKGPIVRLAKESDKIPKGMSRITYMENGKKNFLAVPKEVGDILQGADAQTFDIVTSAIGKIHNVFRQAVTTYNPLFVFLRNPARDFKSFLINSRNVPVRRAVDQYAAAMFDSLAHSNSAIQKIFPNSGKWTEEFLRSGGGQAGYFAREGGQMGKGIAKTAKEITGKRSIAGRIVTSPRDLMQAMSEAIEMAPRVAEYKAGTKKGLSKEESAIAGREVTVDFAQGGNVAKVANQWIPFLNARAQGTRRMAQAFRENPKRALTVWAATGIVPIAALMAWNQANYKDVWENIPDYEKENNFLFILGNQKDKSGRYTQVVRIPKGDIDKILGNTFETMLDNFMGEKGNTAQQLLGSLVSGASNVSPVSFANGSKVNAASVMSGVLPPIAKVPTEFATNHNLFKDAPIVPDSLQGAPSRDQRNGGTSPLAAFLGDTFGVSPLQADNAMQGLAGNVPQDLYNAANLNNSSAERISKGASGAAGSKIETEFYKVYGPTKKTKDYRTNQIYKLIDDGKYRQAQRVADDYNRDVDKRFTSYFKSYGAYLPDKFDLSGGASIDPLELIDNLKINVQVSKKGKPYISR